MTTVSNPAPAVDTDDLDLLGNELEADLRDTVRSYLAERCQPDAVAACYDGDRTVVPGLWRGLAAELGLAGLLVPEEFGGAGAGPREAAVVAEEIGRQVAPVPFLTSAVIATVALTHAPTDAGRALLGELAAGEKTAAVVVPWTVAYDVPVVAATEGARITSVAGALEADVLLVPVAGADGVALRAVPADQARLEPVTSLDMSRQLADVTLPALAGDDVVAGPDGDAAVRAGLLTGTALLAAEQLGVAQWCLTTTVEYLKVRRQFGRIVGGYQALKHRLADLFTNVEGANAAVRYAAAVLAAGAGGREDEIATRIAQAWCADVAVTAAEEAIQLHGGIGMTWEHPAHLYLKRAKADQLGLGLPGAHRARLGELVDLTL